jgi:hypothetical protein
VDLDAAFHPAQTLILSVLAETRSHHCRPRRSRAGSPYHAGANAILTAIQDTRWVAIPHLTRPSGHQERRGNGQAALGRRPASLGETPASALHGLWCRVPGYA